MKFRDIKDLINGIESTFKTEAERLTTIKETIGYKEDNQLQSSFHSQSRIDSRWPQEKLQELRSLSYSKIQALKSVKMLNT